MSTTSLVYVFALFAVLMQSTLLAQNNDRSADELAIRANADAYKNAFQQGDAKSLADMWVEDGEYIDKTGFLMRGRDVIENAFAAFFKNQIGASIEIEIDSIKFPKDDVAIETGSNRTTTRDGKSSGGKYSISYVKRDGKWLMLSVHELPPQSTSNYDHLAELEWLIGNWMDDPESLQDQEAPLVHIAAYWSPNRNFIIRDFTATKGGEATNLGTQRIGWHAPSGQIRSWTFDTSGGIVTGTWQKNGDGWLVSAKESRSNGQVLDSIEGVTRNDDGSQSWRITNRCLSGNPLPDESFRVVRFQK